MFGNTVVSSGQHATHLPRRGKRPKNAEKVLTLNRSTHLFTLSKVRLDIAQMPIRLDNSIPHLLQLFLGYGAEPEHFSSIPIADIGKVGREGFSYPPDIFEHLFRGTLHVEKVDSVRFGGFGQLVDEPFDVGKVLRHDFFQKVQQILTPRRFRVDQLGVSVIHAMAYSVNTGNFETKRSAGIICPIEIVAHHEDDVEQLSEQLGIAQIVARGGE